MKQKNRSIIPVIALLAIALSLLAVEPVKSCRSARTLVDLATDPDGMETMKVDSIISQSDFVLTGKVLSSRSYWTSDTSLILTDYVIEVAEQFKGDTRQTIELTIEGGQVGDILLEVSAYPKLQKDVAYLLVLIEEPYQAEFKYSPLDISSLAEIGGKSGLLLTHIRSSQQDNERRVK